MPRLDTRAVGELWAFKTHLLIQDFSEGGKGCEGSRRVWWELGRGGGAGLGGGVIAKATLSSDSA